MSQAQRPETRSSGTLKTAFFLVLSLLCVPFLAVFLLGVDYKQNYLLKEYITTSASYLDSVAGLAGFKNPLSSILNDENDHGLLYTLKDLATREPKCPIFPKIHGNEETLNKIFFDQQFYEESLAKLAGAVRIPTESFDDMGPVDTDERWKVMLNLHDYLEKTFPTVYETLEFEKVNTYGLVYTWKGSDPSLKASMYIAHQDVVPIDESSAAKWTHDPYGAEYDGKFLWGRGTADCKNLLIGILESIELLIAEGFKPKRTILVAFGFDEEISGFYGARVLGQYLVEKMGKDSVISLLDEGVGGVQKEFGVSVVSPQTGEKGYADSIITFTAKGGHASLPPPHTGIGIVSELIYNIENNPFEASLTEDHPEIQHMNCLMEHAPGLPDRFKLAIANLFTSPKALDGVMRFFSNNRFLRYLVRTTQSVDTIKGGSKYNALPETVTFQINHRIAVGSSGAETHEHILKEIIKVAKKYGAAVRTIYPKKRDEGLVEVLAPADPDSIVIPDAAFEYSVGTPTEPAPVGKFGSKSWQVLSGTLRTLFEDYASKLDDSITSPVLVTPGLVIGNTDTRWYWNLTTDIYRFNPFMMHPLTYNIHSVDERLDFNTHLVTVGYLYSYMKNIDEVPGNNE